MVNTQYDYNTIRWLTLTDLLEECVYADSRQRAGFEEYSTDIITEFPGI